MLGIPRSQSQGETMGEKYDEDYPMSQEEMAEFDRPDENGVYPSFYELQMRAIEKRAEEEDEAIERSYIDTQHSYNTYDCPLCMDEGCDVCQPEAYDPWAYDPWDESGPDYCPDCGCVYPYDLYVSSNGLVCACSPLYPDLRPSDLPAHSCSCNVVKYHIMYQVFICPCSSPDLYALLERQYILTHCPPRVLPSQTSAPDQTLGADDIPI